MTDQTQQPTGFFANEPVLLTHAIGAVIAFAGTSVGLDQSGTSRLINLVVPGAVGLALMLQGLLLRRYVSPAWKATASFIKKETGVDLTGSAEAQALFAELGLNLDGSVADPALAPPPPQPGQPATTPTT